MEKGTPIFTSQVLKHVTQDKSYSWSIKNKQIRRIFSHKRIFILLKAQDQSIGSGSVALAQIKLSVSEKQHRSVLKTQSLFSTWSPGIFSGFSFLCGLLE